MEERERKFREFRKDVKRHLGLPEDFEKIGNLLDIIEKKVIEHAFTVAEGNQSEAARLLGMGRYALRYKAEKHGLLKPKRRGSESSRKD